MLTVMMSEVVVVMRLEVFVVAVDNRDGKRMEERSMVAREVDKRQVKERSECMREESEERKVRRRK